MKDVLGARGAGSAPEVMQKAMFDGLVHHVESRNYATPHSVIYRDDDGRTWKPFGRLPLELSQRPKSSERLARRLFHTAVHHPVSLTDSALVVFGYRRSGGLTLRDNTPGPRRPAPCFRSYIVAAG